MCCLAAAGEVFFQRAEIWGFSVMIDYWPRRLDLAALKAGNLAEVTIPAHRLCIALLWDSWGWG